MNKGILNIENYIEHTLLKPDAAEKEVEKLVKEAIEYNFFGICVNPCHIKFCKNSLINNPVNIITVIGFPLGANLSVVKMVEAEKAVNDGADELDMVINIGDIKDKNFNKAEEDILSVVKAAQDKKVKVIIETDLLSKEEIITACKISANAGAHFVKTSTGFVKDGKGATVENIKLMKDTVSEYGLQVKASGGIRDKKSAIELINAGASRIGTSSSIKIVME